MLKERLARTAVDDQGYRPRIFRLPDDEAALARLLEARPHIQVLDRLHHQLRELVKSLFPARKFTPNELEDGIVNHLGGRSLHTYGSWVFYPWRDQLVHLLDAEEFAWVRTDRNRNKITREEQALLATKRVGVIGLSVGQSVSLTMASERCFGEIRLADFDTLDLSNLNRIRTGTGQLGLNKAVTTAREIAELDPYLQVTCFTEGLTQENLDAFFTAGGKLDVVVEECDSVDIKILARQKAKALGIPVVMDMSDRGCLDVERFDLEPDRPLMHGWIDHLDLDAARRPMSAEEKVPYMLPITGVETLSPRMKASVIELGQTISTWPQLATSVVLGGALAGDAVRRILLGQFSASGRWHVDLEEQVADPKPPPPAPRPVPPPFRPDLDGLAALALAPLHPAATELDDPQAAELVAAACAAPSAGNRQPWQFVRNGKRLLVLEDAGRAASVWDPDRMMAKLSLGACVENMAVMARTWGLEARVHPLAEVPLHVAAWLEFLPVPGGPAPSSEQVRLAAQIPERRTDRSIGNATPIPPEAMEQLGRIAGRENGCAVHWAHGAEALHELGELFGQAERMRLMHPEGHREYFNELIRWPGGNGKSDHDGLHVGTFGLPPMAEAALKVMSDPRAMDAVRSWNGGQGLGMLPRMSVSTSSAVALVTVDQDGPAAWLAAGRCAQHLWLSCAAEGWAVQPLASPIALPRTNAQVPEHFTASQQEQVQAIAGRLQRVFGLSGQVPVLLLRIFHPAHPGTRLRSKRRPLNNMLHTLDPHPHESRQ